MHARASVEERIPKESGPSERLIKLDARTQFIKTSSVFCVCVGLKFNPTNQPKNDNDHEVPVVLFGMKWKPMIMVIHFGFYDLCL